jgi:hypothetical protein
MMTSIDGRIVPTGWMCGRITTEPFAKRVRSEAEVARHYAGDAPRDDFRASGEHDSFAFAVDPSGRLAWESNDIDGDHVVDQVAALGHAERHDGLDVEDEPGQLGRAHVLLPVELERHAHERGQGIRELFRQILVCGRGRLLRPTNR